MAGALWQSEGRTGVHPKLGTSGWSGRPLASSGRACYLVDSNLDWGQDVRRLRAFVEAHHLEQIAMDYFGGGSPADALGERYVPWASAKGLYPGWFVVSVSRLTVA